MRGSVLMTQTMFLILLLFPLSARSASGHQHGVAKLDVAYDQGALSIELETPLMCSWVSSERRVPTLNEKVSSR